MEYEVRESDFMGGYAYTFTCSRGSQTVQSRTKKTIEQLKEDLGKLSIRLYGMNVFEHCKFKPINF